MIDVFISYRHNSGQEFASFLNYRLKGLGYNVFLDEKKLYENGADGEFAEKIAGAIEKCTFFLLLLAPGDLDVSTNKIKNDWILRESKMALELGKVIIPIMIKEGFEFPEESNEPTSMSCLKEKFVTFPALMQTSLLKACLCLNL